MEAPTAGRESGSNTPLISVEEYLSECYEPDCDYVDGRVEERNFGEWTHGRLQLKIGAYFLTRQRDWNTFASTECRIRVKPTRVRLPDVCVFLGDPGQEVSTKPPFICIEVLSPEDRMSRAKKRLQDFLDMGVPYVWILDPQTREAYTLTAAEGLHEVNSGILRTENPAFEVPLADLFE